MALPHTFLLMLALAPSLIVARQTPPKPFADGTVVGRARCGGSTWLLTDRRELTRWFTYDATPVVTSVSGLRAGDRPWGLACLGDGSLWTLAAPVTLARLDAAGRVQERIDLPLPRVSLFGVGDRVLFQQFPIAVGGAALSVAPPRQANATRPWAGLVNSGDASREREIARNLVTCGIGAGTRVPCWFAEARRLSVSDGVTNRLLNLDAILEPIGDTEAPIHDVALTDRGQWILAGARLPPGRQRGGVRIVYQTADETGVMALDLSAAARLILMADDDRCVLLGVDGRVVEVVSKR